MQASHGVAAGLVALGMALAGSAQAAEMCTGYGPQAPRDITVRTGKNPVAFSLAPDVSRMNLCNIHMHVGAEHAGPGFRLKIISSAHHGYQCNETASLSPEELKTPEDGACHGIKAGDTIEVHWVYSTCDVKPGEGLKACFSNKCSNPELRVESQVFLLVNDPTAAHFDTFAAAPAKVQGFWQASSLPSGLGDPVVYRGSTTGDKYSDSKCSPAQVTWSVRPQCVELDISSLERWCQTNVFNEHEAHGVRPLVTAPELLAPIE